MIRRPPRSTLFPSRRSSDLMDPAVLSWDNASNNQWLNSGAGSWIHNPISHYVVAKEKQIDRKSTRLNSSHGYISYAVFCLKKKKKKNNIKRHKIEKRQNKSI